MLVRETFDLATPMAQMWGFSPWDLAILSHVEYHSGKIEIKNC